MAARNVRNVKGRERGLVGGRESEERCLEVEEVQEEDGVFKVEEMRMKVSLETQLCT